MLTLHISFFVTVCGAPSTVVKSDHYALSISATSGILLSLYGYTLMHEMFRFGFTLILDRRAVCFRYGFFSLQVLAFISDSKFDPENWRYRPCVLYIDKINLPSRYLTDFEDRNRFPSTIVALKQTGKFKRSHVIKIR